MSSYTTYTCEPTLSAVATAHVAVISTVVTSSPTAATAHVAVVSSTNTSSLDQATAHAAVNSLIGQEAGVEDGNKVETDRIAVKHADVSVLKSCLKKANVVSPILKIAKQVEWNAMHEYQIYDVQLEERTDTGKFALDAGEINWADWRAQKKWNEKNFDIIDAEWRMIVYKMDNVADWDPDFDLDFDEQREEAADMVEDHDVLHMIDVLEDYAKELEKEQQENALKSYDSGWDIILFGANPSLLDVEAPFSLSTDPNHPDNIFDRNIELMNIARANHRKLVRELAELRKEVEARVNEEGK
ncbi:hypothetical protein QFC24_003961 [Naganishia onofrii]|uniref:Uncharacterized protein n=1 Tax=Naganishia onofrii TaxID=1851511 RepID=A0ACC2XGG5_9TREE|nr:hypothetical protein QFC24_003961 [Naganishia onofrii]